VALPGSFSLNLFLKVKRQQGTAALVFLFNLALKLAKGKKKKI
jgi:hypothetical protein